MEIILAYPIWFIGFCLLLGAIYAGVLYYRANHFTEDGPNFSWIKKGLAFLRFLSASILAFLLLSPFIKSKFIDKVDPIIVFAHDNSESILLNLNSEDSAAYINNTNEMLANLSEKYQIDYYAFDEDIREIDTLNFKGKSSNLSHALSQLNGLYFNQNIGAVIFATDGIYNQGNNPIYTDFNFPVYTVALGDTNQQTDLKIVNVRNNKLAYLKDKIQVDISLQANHLQGKNYTLTLSEKGTKLDSKQLPITKDFDEQTTSFTIEANSIGIHKYVLNLEAFDTEISTLNNRYEFYIEVIDNRQKILLVANAPHPDLAAIKSVVELNKNFEIDIQFANRFQGNIDDYSLCILHQLPSQNLGAKNVLSAVANSKIPTWHITGNANAYNQLNQAQNVVQITTNGSSTNDASALYNASFSSFTISENTASKLRKFPPVITPFGDYKLGANSSTLLRQKIGTVDTDFPILAFQDNFGVRAAIFVGDGLWRWKLYDFLENNSNDAFNEIVEKTINYLALKGDKRKFRVSTNKTAYNEGEAVIFQGELYNENYELVNTPDVNMTLKNDDGDEFPFAFSKTEKAYQFKTNSLPIGSYNYTATTTFNGKKLEANGAFSISAMHLEAIQTTANHTILKQLADKTNGRFIPFDEVEKIDDYILAEESIKPTLYESFKTRSIINLFSIFILLMLLLSLEWFARKWYGAY